MKKILTLLLCAFMALGAVACGGGEENKEADYKLGMGIVVNMDSSATGNAQVDATVATVVTDKDGKIVACRIDVAQNKMAVADGAVDTAKVFETKMELGTRYGMSTSPYSPDNNGDGIVKEWDVQTKIFEEYVVGKTGAQVQALELQEVGGHMISKDDALLTAGCTIQITDYIEAIVKACADEQGMTFTTAKEFTLGVAAKTTAEESTAATAEAEGSVKMYSDFAATVIAEGKILCALNDAIQPAIAINAAGEIVTKSFTATKRELKEDYHMAAYGQSMDWNGDGKVLEWYIQSAEFSKYVVGKTAAEVEAMPTKVVESSGYIISSEDALLTAGCTIQITSIKAVMAQAAKNAR